MVLATLIAVALAPIAALHPQTLPRSHAVAVVSARIIEGARLKLDSPNPAVPAAHIYRGQRVIAFD